MPRCSFLLICWPCWPPGCVRPIGPTTGPAGWVRPGRRQSYLTVAPVGIADRDELGLKRLGLKQGQIPVIHETETICPKKQKTLHPIRDEGARSAVPPCFTAYRPHAQCAIAGAPAAGWGQPLARHLQRSPASSAYGLPQNPAGLSPSAPARWRLAYYSGSTRITMQLCRQWTQRDSNPRPSQCH